MLFKCIPYTAFSSFTSVTCIMATFGIYKLYTLTHLIQTSHLDVLSNWSVNCLGGSSNFILFFHTTQGVNLCEYFAKLFIW